MAGTNMDDAGWSTTGMVRYLPNSVTALALCSGLVSIRFSIEQQFDHALSAIVISALLDGIDGRLARRLHVCSRFGEEFDSLADFLSFGLAPVVLLFFWSEEYMGVFLSVCLAAFVMASATRLARFNAQSDEPRAYWRKAYFVGLPTPSAALAVLLPISIVEPTAGSMPWVTTYTLLVAFLMVSTVPTYSGKTIRLGETRTGRNLILALCMVGIAATFFYPREVLVAFTVVYLASIPVSWISFRHQRRLQPDGVIVPIQPST